MSQIAYQEMNARSSNCKRVCPCFYACSQSIHFSTPGGLKHLCWCKRTGRFDEREKGLKNICCLNEFRRGCRMFSSASRLQICYAFKNKSANAQHLVGNVGNA